MVSKDLEILAKDDTCKNPKGLRSACLPLKRKDPLPTMIRKSTDRVSVFGTRIDHRTEYKNALLRTGRSRGVCTHALPLRSPPSTMVRRRSGSRATFFFFVLLLCLVGFAAFVPVFAPLPCSSPSCPRSTVSSFLCIKWFCTPWTLIAYLVHWCAWFYYFWLV